MRLLLAFYLSLVSVATAATPVGTWQGLPATFFPGTVILYGDNGAKLEITEYMAPTFANTSGFQLYHDANMSFRAYGLPDTPQQWISPVGIGFGERDYITGVDQYNEYLIEIRGLEFPLSEYSFYKNANVGWPLYKTTPEQAYANIFDITSVVIKYGSTSGREIDLNNEWAWGTYTRPTVVYPPTISQGDLDQDGSVDAADAARLFGNWTGDSAPSVPEPTGLLPILLLIWRVRGIWRVVPTE